MVAALPVDWNGPLDNQLSDDQQSVDLIIVSDCVWLACMLLGLLATVAIVFQHARSRSPGRCPKLLISFQRRDSWLFATVDQVLSKLSFRGWPVDCLACYPLNY